MRIGAITAALCLGAALAGCGDDEEAVDVCAAMTQWDHDMVAAANELGRTAEHAPDGAARRVVYLDGFDRLAELTEQLGEDARSAMPELAAATERALDAVAAGKARAEGLDDAAFDPPGVPTGGFFSTSDAARARVLSVAPDIC